MKNIMLMIVTVTLTVLILVILEYTIKNHTIPEQTFLQKASEINILIQKTNFRSAQLEINNLLSITDKKENKDWLLKKLQEISYLLSPKGIKESKLKKEAKLIQNAKLAKEAEVILKQETAKKAKMWAKARKKLRSNRDNIDGITWYRDKETVYYTNRNSVHIYMGTSGGALGLRFVIQYYGNSWLFIKSYTIKTDKKTWDIPIKYSDRKSDNGGGMVWEWVDVAPSEVQIEMLKDIATSKTVKIRYRGKDYIKDRTITNREKRGISNVLAAYYLLK